jgi:hypothetical protein
MLKVAQYNIYLLNDGGGYYSCSGGGGDDDDDFLIIKPTRCTNFSNLFWE